MRNDVRIAAAANRNGNALEIKYKIRSLVTWELDPLTVTTMTEAGGESLVGLDFNYSMEREHGQHSS
jgi:hypothetical protein